MKNLLLILLIPYINLSERPEHGQEGLVIRVRVDETTEAASTCHQAFGKCDRDRWVGIVLSIWCLKDADLGVITTNTYLSRILQNMSSIGVPILGNFHCFKIEPIMVIIEYVPYGDLLGYLRKSRGLNDTYYKDPDVKPRTNLTSQQLIKFAWQVADEMEYLSNKKVGY